MQIIKKFLFIIGFLCFFFIVIDSVSAQPRTNQIQAIETPFPSSSIILNLKNEPLVLPETITSKEEKGWWVFESLREQAETSQQHIIKLLNESEIKHQAFWITNTIVIEEVNDHLEDIWIELMSSPEIVSISSDAPIQISSFQAISTEKTSMEDSWGIERIGVPAVWALGIKGNGVVIGGQDTGYEWEHEALKKSYRGWQSVSGGANHNYHWHDAIHQINPFNTGDNPCGLDSMLPCDDHRHGTHTMGTMAGANFDGMNIGIAPEAKWVGCRNMERGWGMTSTYLECFQWFLAPTNLENNFPNPSLAPHVINNSWSCPPEEGCNPDNFEVLETAIEHLIEAGVVVVTSAGNSGNAGGNVVCGSVQTPPSIFEASFAVGATNDTDMIAAFSSRGPVTADGSNRLKPDVVAPGVQILSSLLNNTYGKLSGTSMSGPHVAGVVALMIAANPLLSGRVETIKQILIETAIPLTTTDGCGNDTSEKIPNHTFGYGRIDAYAAVESAMAFTIETPLQNQMELTVFPNPIETVGSLALKSEIKGVYSVQIVDILGRIRLELGDIELDRVATSYIPFSVASLPRGFYFFIVSNETSLSKAPFLIKGN